MRRRRGCRRVCFKLALAPSGGSLCSADHAVTLGCSQAGVGILKVTYQKYLITEVFKLLLLGYLQQENLTSTCQTFILESSNLKEYAEHCTDEGFIPACLLSLFGKNLTTILNEYVAMKAKGTCKVLQGLPPIREVGI
ncbi:hypothetical protein U0070_020003 [Myodes glareolus]|uniref:Uncharacterized protein n=1 Tax=Myodes glareolus TaxID=447135 RepID=A0AAW0I9L4_MYOGA